MYFVGSAQPKSDKLRVTVCIDEYEKEKEL
jgi:hypothetical protein